MGDITKAIEIAKQNRDCFSISLLQRKLLIGYIQAAKLVDQMKEIGVIGDCDANGKRTVLITEEAQP